MSLPTTRPSRQMAGVLEGLNEFVPKARARAAALEKMFYDQVALHEQIGMAVVETASKGDADKVIALLEASAKESPVKKACELNGQILKIQESFHDLSLKPPRGLTDPLSETRRAKIIEA